MFIQKEYDENDQRAKNKFIELFYNTTGYKKYTLEYPLNEYSVDFIVKNKDNIHIANIEVEVKKSWNRYDFPYDDIQLLVRKPKFWTESIYTNGCPTTFVMFNNDLSNHLVIFSNTMIDIIKRGDTRYYGTEKTRYESFLVAKRDEVVFSYFGNNR